MNKNRLAVFYDGACHLCSREIEHYRKKDTQNKIDFIDIAAADFDAAKYQLDPKRVQLEMHVKLPNGEIRTAVDAFRALWEVLPGYEWMSKAVNVPGLRQVIDLGYLTFARAVRPYLPKRKDHCTTGTCHPHKH